MKRTIMLAMLLGLATSCGGSTPATTSTTPQPVANSGPTATPAVATAKPKESGLDKLMRTRMNKSYTQLVFFVLNSETDVELDKIEHEAKELQAAVVAVRSLQHPPMVQSEEAKSVYGTYNDVLQRDADKFFASVVAKDRPQMEMLLTKIGKTCNDCHRFFRVDVKEPAK